MSAIASTPIIELSTTYLAETSQFFYGDGVYNGTKYNGEFWQNPVAVITDSLVRVGPAWGWLIALVGFAMIFVIIWRIRKRHKDKPSSQLNP